MRPCNCTPTVPGPRFRGHIETGGICIYSLGRTEEEALDNVIDHARKDGIARSTWAEVWVETIDGVLVREVKP